MKRIRANFVRYGLAVAGIVLATVIRDRWDVCLKDDHPFVFNYIAVFLLAWYVGSGPAWLAWFLGGAVSFYLFVRRPLYSFTVIDPRDYLDITSFVVVGVASILLIQQRKRAEQRVLAHQHKLRSLASELVLAGERERQRVVLCLHDRVGQALAGSKIKLGLALREAAGTAAGRLLEEINVLIQEVIDETRTLTVELSPPVPHELGLEKALAWLAEHVQQQHGLKCSVESRGPAITLREDTSVVLFQATRELLLNVVKHAHAAEAKVVVSKEPDWVYITVADNGVGCDMAAVARSPGSHSFGLFSIRERLTYLGGRMEVQTEPGRGTRVTLSMPAAADPATKGKA
ncbi:MAG: sensor histidine kinase [Planctomycetota bacterium]